MVKKKTKIICLVLIIIFIGIGLTFFILGTIPPKEYEIKFKIDDERTNSLMVYKNDKIPEPLDPSKEGYEFLGWFYNDKLYDFKTKVKSNMTLKAKWQEVKVEITNPLSLNVSELTLNVGEESTLEANSTEALTWESADNTIATVTDGLVKAVKVGTVTVTVKNEAGEEASCVVTIKEKSASEVSVTKITISGQTEVTVGENLQLKANITPTKATNKTVTWSSSKKNIATVDNNGLVKALKVGDTVITATSSNGKKASVKVVVKDKVVEPTPEPTPEEPKEEEKLEIAITGKDTAKPGEEIKLSIKYTPDTQENKNKKVIWQSDNENITVEQETGYVKIPEDALDGTITITATIEGTEIKASHTITIKSDYTLVITRSEEIIEPSTGEEDDINKITISFLKNGQASDFESFTYNGITSKTLKYSQVKKKNVSSVEVTISEGITVTASVQYVGFDEG